MIAKEKIENFQSFIWNFYALNKRDFPWRAINGREISDPYKIFVSEVMLQQTQTDRVIDKYEMFMAELPSFDALASASLRDLLSVWQGLGYNRRALYLQKTAQKIIAEFSGKLPADQTILKTFPGIGPATAASICAFAFNMPTVFIETNIRAVFIYSFFKDEETVSDAQIFPLVEKTLDQDNPREWYYALMDYGVFLKKRCANPSRKSAHHAIQSRFEGSDRQIRGAALRLLTNNRSLSFIELVQRLKKDSDRVERIIGQLCAEGFIKRSSRDSLQLA